MIRRPPRSTQGVSSAASDVYKRQDQEGGRVQRFNIDFTKIPSMQKVSEYAKSMNDVLFLKEIGWLISSELVAAGIDVNFAPVLDIDRNTSSVIGDRAFSDKADEVVFLASRFIDGMHEAGMKSTGKHFPGHGGIYEDSHKEIAKDSRNLDELLPVSYTHLTLPTILLV